MILDCFKNLKQYTDLHPGFLKANEFLSQPELSTLSEGKYEIDSDHVFATVAKGLGRKKEEGLLEVHEKYIDIQWILSGTDTMGWKPRNLCQNSTGGYNPDKDIQFFADEPDAWIPVKDGMFVIFFPEDAHLPLISAEEIHKVIIKIKV